MADRNEYMISGVKNRNHLKLLLFGELYQRIFFFEAALV